MRTERFSDGIDQKACGMRAHRLLLSYGTIQVPEGALSSFKIARLVTSTQKLMSNVTNILKNIVARQNRSHFKPWYAIEYQLVRLLDAAR